MPFRPFPFQLGIGTDIIHIPRIKRLLLKDGHDKAPQILNRYLNNFLTYREQKIFRSRFLRDVSHDASADLWARDDALMGRIVTYLAGRWAAKEAVIKAYQREIGFKHIQILPRRIGKGEVSGAIYGLVLDSPASAYAWKKPAAEDILEAAETTADADAQDQLIDDAVEAASGTQGDEEKFTPSHQQTDGLHGQIVEISISHDGDYATAVCLAPREPQAGDVGGEAAAREP